MGCSQSKVGKDGKTVIKEKKSIGGKADGKSKIVKISTGAGASSAKSGQLKDSVGSGERNISLDLAGSADDKVDALTMKALKTTTETTGSMTSKTNSVADSADHNSTNVSNPLSNSIEELSGSFDGASGAIKESFYRKQGDHSGLVADTHSSDLVAPAAALSLSGVPTLKESVNAVGIAAPAVTAPSMTTNLTGAPITTSFLTSDSSTVPSNTSPSGKNLSLTSNLTGVASSGNAPTIGGVPSLASNLTGVASSGNAPTIGGVPSVASNLTGVASSGRAPTIGGVPSLSSLKAPSSNHLGGASGDYDWRARANTDVDLSNIGSHTDSLLKKTDISSSATNSAFANNQKLFGDMERTSEADSRSKLAQGHDQLSFEKKMLNAIHSKSPEIGDTDLRVPGESTIIENATMNPISLNASQKNNASYIPRTSGIPHAVLSSPESYKKPPSPQSISTTFSPRLDVTYPEEGKTIPPVVPTLGLGNLGLPSSVELEGVASPVNTTGSGQAGMSVKEMVGNIAKRRSSIPIPADPNKTVSRSSLSPGQRTPNLGASGKFNSDRRISTDPSRKSPNSINRLSQGRSPSPLGQSGLRPPSARTMVGNGKWGDGPQSYNDSSRSQRSNSPRDKYERESDTSSMNGGGDSLYCSSTGRRLTKSPSEKRELGGIPDEVGSVRGVVASWDHRVEVLPRDTAKSRATKEATLQREITPGNVSLLEKRCTF